MVSRRQEPKLTKHTGSRGPESQYKGLDGLCRETKRSGYVGDCVKERVTDLCGASGRWQQRAPKHLTRWTLNLGIQNLFSGLFV